MTSWERRGNYRGSSELLRAIIVSANAKTQLKPGTNILLATVQYSIYTHVRCDTS